MLHFSTSRTELHRIISLTQNVVSKKATNPVLSNFLISGKENTIRVIGSDLDVPSLATIPCRVEKEGTVCIKAGVFSDLVKELPEGPVDFQVGSNYRVQVTAGSARLALVGASGSDYPNFKGLGLQLRGRVISHHLSEMISKTLYAVCHDETRYHLNGICFEVEPASSESGNASLRSIALDGFRLATVSRPCIPPSITEQIIVPKKGLSELRRILDDEPVSEVEFDIIEGMLVVRTRNVELCTRLIDGEFPPYQRLYAPNRDSIISVDGRELLRALRRASLLAAESWKCVQLDLSRGRLRVSTSSADLGDASEELSADYDGKPFSVGYNVRSLIDLISALGEDQDLCFELYGGSFPGKFWGRTDPASFAILMPMRLNPDDDQKQGGASN